MIKTSVIGSYAWPAWFITAVDAMQQGQYGLKDIEETLNDAVDLAIREQEEAGVDIISDGEMRRLGFFTADFYGRLQGLTELPPLRRIGPGGHDQRERYEAHETFDAPDGLGLVAEYRYARTRTTRPIKIPVPGPYTLAGRIAPGKIYKDRMEVAHRFAQIINRELKALVAAGVDFIQLDEPSAAVHKDTPKAFIDLFNGMLDGVNARISVHLCFGNYIGRPVANRTFAPVFPAILDLKVQEFAIEFANREMAEIEVCAAIVESGKDVAAGLVDVKNYFIETPEIVAERIRKTLKHVPPERLTVTPDCGFSQTARWASRAKMNAMVAGTRIVNASL
ncbi:MAG: cobalamin-independent methionine synthase II family protein [Rhodothermales bacterium]|nr:cobalamin-independent methionine synthase II family protein [Rhodothermales bacterium]